MNVKNGPITSELIVLEGASNFRDFGVCFTADGRRVRRGLLFRSNKLSVLTDTDRERLDAAGIRTIFDLRLDDERERDPTAWSHPELVIETYPPRKKRRLVDMALEYPPTEAGALQLMHDFYAKMPHSMTHMFSAIIRRLAAGGAPCVIHCSAGKDRTGVACAMVLAALGVEREGIVADYVITRHAWDREADMARATMNTGADTGAVTDLRERYPPEARAVMSDAAPGYIEAALASAEERYGSLEAYLADGLELEPEVIAALRTELLEPE
jgi:protein-tyrosine phosphatase